MKTENLLQFSGRFTLSQLNPALISTFLSLFSNVNMLDENSSLNSNKEFILHPCQVWFRNRLSGYTVIYVSSSTFRDSRDVQMAIHTAYLTSFYRTVTNNYIRV